MAAAPSKRLKNRSSTLFHTAANPSTLVFTLTCACESAEGSSSTSRSPEPTTPTCTRPVIARRAGKEKLSCSMPHPLLQLQIIQKQARRQQIRTATGRGIEAQQLAIEHEQDSPAR